MPGATCLLVGFRQAVPTPDRTSCMRLLAAERGLEPEAEGGKDQDDADVAEQACPNVVPEEQEVDTDDGGYERKHIQHDGRPSSHKAMLPATSLRATSPLRTCSGPGGSFSRSVCLPSRAYAVAADPRGDLELPLQQCRSTSPPSPGRWRRPPPQWRSTIRLSPEQLGDRHPPSAAAERQILEACADHLVVTRWEEPFDE